MTTFQAPLWVAGLVPAVLVFVFLAAGFTMGRAHARRYPDRESGPVGATVGACLGLLAFLLGFTFSLAASRLDERKALLLDESNAIGTAWLRADLLAPDARDAARALLEEYTAVRIGADRQNDLAAAIERSEAIHRQLWAIAVDAMASPAKARLFVVAINEVIDLHGKRVVFGLQYRIPPPIWLGVVLVTAMAMASLGYMLGLAGTFRYPVSIALAVAFSAVIFLIADIDRPLEGFVRVDPQPLRDVLASFRQYEVRSADP